MTGLGVYEPPDGLADVRVVDRIDSRFSCTAQRGVRQAPPEALQSDTLSGATPGCLPVRAISHTRCTAARAIPGSAGR